MALGSPIVFAIAPDRQTEAYARRALSRAGIDAAFARAESSAVTLFPKIRAAGARAVVAVLDSRFPLASLGAIQACGASGGLALCLSEPFGARSSDRGGWVLGQLWTQRGGVRCPDLATVLEAIRVHAFIGPDGVNAVRTAPPRSAIAARLGALAARLGVLHEARGKPAVPLLEIAASGEVRLRKAGARLELVDPEASLRALGLLASRHRPGSDRKAADTAIDTAVVDLIVRPPARTLSEVASKRLLEAYGVSIPRERLCASPTESARYAGELGAPVVLKLVRPATPDKSLAGAVRLGVSGAAHVRRAHHEIMRCGGRLGPPPPLGVLVSPELRGGARVWIAREPHPELGLLVVGGSGDRKSATPEFALAAPATTTEARRALAAAGIEAGPSQLDALADAIARFSRLVADLDDRIDLAEIHPLVAPEDGPALALDALFSISG